MVITKIIYTESTLIVAVYVTVAKYWGYTEHLLLHCTKFSSQNENLMLKLRKLFISWSSVLSVWGKCTETFLILNNFIYCIKS